MLFADRHDNQPNRGRLGRLGTAVGQRHASASQLVADRRRDHGPGRNDQSANRCQPPGEFGQCYHPRADNQIAGRRRDDGRIRSGATAGLPSSAFPGLLACTAG